MNLKKTLFEDKHTMPIVSGGPSWSIVLTFVIKVFAILFLWLSLSVIITLIGGTLFCIRSHYSSDENFCGLIAVFVAPVAFIISGIITAVIMKFLGSKKSKNAPMVKNIQEVNILVK